MPESPNGHPIAVEDVSGQAAGAGPTSGVGLPVPPVATPQAQWRVALADGSQYGPTEADEFAEWIRAGRVPRDGLVWRTGWSEWRRVADAQDELPAQPPGSIEGRANRSPSPRIAAAAATDSPSGAIPTSASAKTTYALRRRIAQRRRLTFAIVLAVACLLLAGMLVWLVASGPPAGAPVIPR